MDDPRRRRNVLFTGDYDGTVLHPRAATSRRFRRRQDGARRAGAGVEWDDLVAWAVRNGLGGIENLSLIPGYVGAAPVQNIGLRGRGEDMIEASSAC
ncbi:MAG: FAD-binding protein [Alistipes sp.]